MRLPRNSTPSVNKLTMLGVIGNLMSCRLIGIDTLRFILAKTPSVGLTSHWSSFCSASKRSSADNTRCHWSDGTDSQTIPSSAVSHCLHFRALSVFPRASFEQLDVPGDVLKA